MIVLVVMEQVGVILKVPEVIIDVVVDAEALDDS